MSEQDSIEGELDGGGHSHSDFDALIDQVQFNKPQEISVRKLLKFWGYQKRGSTILSIIEKELEKRNLVSVPELATADYYGTVKIRDRRDLSAATDEQAGWPISNVLDDRDRELVWVKRETSLREVETLMVMYNFSQIPVLSPSKRDLHGSVTWESIARFQRTTSASTAREAMTKVNRTAQSSDNLLMHINEIIEHGFIYIRSPENEYVDIITATDLGESFLETTGPFIKLGEIERRIRTLVDQLPLSDIQEVKVPDGSSRVIRGAADLNFGEYIYLLANPEKWTRIGVPFDRVAILNNLEDVNKIRNNVMHFRPHAIEKLDTVAIDWCLNWLRELRPSDGH